MRPSRAKILVIRGGAIGDFILTLPVFAALRAHLPQAGLEVLGYSHIAQLALAGGAVDRVGSIEARALAGFFARGGDLDEDLSDYFSEFSVIVSYLYDPDGIFEFNVARCCPGQFIAGPHRPDERRLVPASEVFLKPLERLAVFGADAVPQLRLTTDATAPLPAGHWLAVHPGSGSERKNWPEASWAVLLEQLNRDSDWNVLMVGGEAEGDRLHRLQRFMPSHRVRVLQGAPLTELGQRLQSCQAFIGHDSGITHLAAAVGLPGLALWGDSVEAIWRPASPRFRVMRHLRGLNELAVETVAGEARRLLAEAAATRRLS